MDNMDFMMIIDIGFLAVGFMVGRAIPKIRSEKWIAMFLSRFFAGSDRKAKFDFHEIAASAGLHTPVEHVRLKLVLSRFVDEGKIGSVIKDVPSEQYSLNKEIS